MLANSMRLLALMTWPIMPTAAQSLWDRLGMEGSLETRAFDSDNKWLQLPEGNKVAAGAPLFPRIDDEKSG